MMTDGTIQGLFFSNNGSINYFTANSFGLQDTFSDAEKTTSLKQH